MNTFGGRLALALVCFVVLVGGMVAVTSVADVAAGPVGTADAATQADNETVRHQDPDEQRDDGDTAAVRRWLENELSRQLGDSVVQLSEGDYETAKEILGDEYQDRYAQYVAVRGETGGGAEEPNGTGDGESTADGPTNDSFREIATEQKRLADLLEEFEATRADYYDAVQADDDERARDLARDIEDLAGRIESRSQNITVHFETIEENTGGNFSESKASIDETNDDVQETREEIIVEQFEPTSLTIEPDGDPERDGISFLEPLEATGTLRTENETPIASRNVTFAIGSDDPLVRATDTRTVRTDEDGSFTLEYRPTTLPLSTTNLSVAYEPVRGSGYMGSETNVSVSIEQRTPELSDLSASQTTAAFESVDVAGAMTVDDVPVDDVSVDLLLDDRFVGNTTVSNGTFEGTAEVPPSIPEGERELTVRFAGADRALANATAGTATTVLESEGELAVAADQFDGDHLNVSGTFTTADGAEIGNEAIELAVDGETVGTVSTDGDGTFATVVELPVAPAKLEGDAVELTASYDGEDSSIAPTATSVDATIASADDSILSSRLLLGGGLVLALAGSIGSLLWFRRRDAADAGSSADRPQDVPRPTDAPSEPEPEPVEPLLSQAASSLSNDRPEEAVRLGYAAVRRAFQSRIEGSRALTHWEFYRRYRGDEAERNSNSNSGSDSLRSMTELYERASYGIDRVSETDAATVLEYARHLCELEEGSDRGRRSDGDYPADD